MSVDPCGAELTGSRTVTACWGGMMIRPWPLKRPMVSWEVAATLATTLTWMA